MTDRDKLIEAIEHCLLCNVVKGSPFDAKEDARDILAAIEANGFAVVPVEPTEAMMDAGLDEYSVKWVCEDIYRAMIAAAPMQGDG